MKIRKSVAAVAAVLLAGGSLFINVTAASATEYPPVCTPSAAWDETIHHEAVGDETITVDNPDYIPATPDTTEPGGFTKWVWTNPENGKGEPAGPPPGEGWHEVGQTSDSKGNTPDTIIHQGNGYGSYFYFETNAVIVHPGTPAVGEPTIEVPNPDYVPASDEVVHHDEVVCDQPEVPTKPEPQTKHVHEEGTPNCDLGEVPVWDATYGDEPVYNAETNSWEFLGHWEKISGEESTREATAEECPVVVTPTPTPTPTPTQPAPLPQQAAPQAPAPAAVLQATQPVSQDVLAQTGSNTLARDIVWAGAALVLVLLGIAALVYRHGRPRYRRQR